jgi:hypothetical protein
LLDTADLIECCLKIDGSKHLYQQRVCELVRCLLLLLLLLLVGGRIILKRIFRKWDVGVWTGLSWPRIERGGGHLLMR